MLRNLTICFAENILTCTTHMFKQRMLTMHICPARLCVWGDNCDFVGCLFFYNGNKSWCTVAHNATYKFCLQRRPQKLLMGDYQGYIMIVSLIVTFVKFHLFPLVCLCRINETYPVFCHRFLCATSTLVHTPPTWTTRACCSVACCFTSVTPSSSPDSSRNSASSKVTHRWCCSHCYSFCCYILSVCMLTHSC